MNLVFNYFIICIEFRNIKRTQFEVKNYVELETTHKTTY